MVFRCIRYGADHPGVRDADLDPDRYEDLNALVPRRFVRNPRSGEALRTSYALGSVTQGGH
jgi:hypothetical protein